MKAGLFLAMIWMLIGCQPLAQLEAEYNILTAVGTASVSAQYGQSAEEKQFKAMRASKLEAYKELSEQVYGLRVSGKMQVDDQRLSDDKTKGTVDGIIRAAEVIASYSVGDSYVTELRLNLRKMEKMQKYGESFHIPRDNTIIF